VSGVELFPGTPLTPEVLVQMEDTTDCKAMVIVKMNADGIVDISMSRLSMADLAFMALKLQLHVNETIQGRPPDGTDVVTPEAS
jgi:hypothetical protein